MAKFKCKYSGNVVEFSLEHDIKAMRVHPDYAEVVDNEVKEVQFKEDTEKRPVGRPKTKE